MWSCLRLISALRGRVSFHVRQLLNSKTWILGKPRTLICSVPSQLRESCLISHGGCSHAQNAVNQPLHMGPNTDALEACLHSNPSYKGYPCTFARRLLSVMWFLNPESIYLQRERN